MATRGMATRGMATRGMATRGMATTDSANDSGDSRLRLLAWAWWIAFGTLLLAILALALYLWLRRPEVIYRDLPPPAADAAQQASLDQARGKAGSLRRQIADLRAELAADRCPPGKVKDPSAPALTIPPALAIPPAGGIQGDSGALPSATPQLANSAAAAAPALPMDIRPGKPLAQRDLVNLLGQAVVLVLTENSSASGFFIAPDYVVTNRHAVEGARDGRVGVTSKLLGGLHIGQVVATTPAGPKGGDDFAIIRLDGVQARAFLPLSLGHEALTPIVSAGYPGLTIVNDEGFRRLLSGDASAAPELVLSRGEIQAVQPSPEGGEVIVHSGDVMQGSSGGPIVDACGRAIGMNTFIAVDEQHSSRVSYALSTRGLAGFVQKAGVPVTIQDGACGN
jgi:serine protease Do